MKKILGVFLLSFAILLLARVAVDFKYADPDGYYHLKVAQLIAQGKIGNTFPWLQATTLNAGFADQHYLFHLLLIPFVYLKVEWLVIPFFSALMFTAFYWLLNKLAIKGKLFWLALAFLGSVDFLFRISLIKANTLSLVLLFVILVLLYQKRFVWLLPVSAIFVWTYGGFVFVPLVVGLWCIVDSLSDKSLSWKPLVYCLLGIASGIALHPQASHLIPYLRAQIFQAGLGANKTIPVGVEWEPYNWLYFFKSNAIVVGLWLASMFILVKQASALTNQRKQWGVFLFALSLGFWLLALLHRRFIEYAAPFSLIFSAYMFNDYVAQIHWQEVKKLWNHHWQFNVSVIIICAFVGTTFYSNGLQVYRYFEFSKPQDAYQGATNWLNSNATSKVVVFNTQWDQFPQLFYGDDKNYYIVGLDPTFMYLYNQALYWKWRQITDDDPNKWSSVAELHSMIKNDFGASYVFIEGDRNSNLSQELTQTGNFFSEVYSDPQDSIFIVR